MVRVMPTCFPPLVIPPRSGLVSPMRRPFNVDKDCVLCLLPEINTKWVDYSGRGNDGTLTGCSKVSSRRIGDAVEFEAGGELVTVAGHSSLDITDYLTVEAWIDLLTPADTYGYVACKETNDPWGIYFQGPADPRTLFFRMSTADSTSNLVTAAVAEGIHHVVCTYDGDAGRTYVDGVLAGTNVALGGAILDDAGDDIVIGNVALGDRDFLGRIGEVRIYHRALALWEIEALYEQGRLSEA